MTPTPDEIRAIYYGIECRPGLALNLRWNSETAIFDEMVGLVKPAIHVEVGAWNGASVIHTAKCCQRRGLKTLIYAVDVFPGRIGDRDHMGNIPATQIPTRWTEPSRYEQFLFNVKASGFDDRVIPVPTFTRWGAQLLANWGVVADTCYIDAGHDEDFAYDDMMNYWNLIRSGGKMFGDDAGYPGVLAALGRFSKEKNVGIGFVGAQWFFAKP